MNRELVKDKLAVRLMGLHENGKSQFDRTYDRDRRMTLALTFKPLSGTTIRLSHEGARIKARRARYLAPQDNISGWIAAGRPTWNAAANAGKELQDVFSDPRQAGAFRELDGVVNNPYAVYTDMTSGDPDFASFLVNVNSSGQNPATGRVQFYRSANPDEDKFEVDPQVGDARMFPLQDVDLASTGGSYQDRDDRKTMLTIAQRVTRDLQFEVGYYRDNTVNDNFNHIFSQSSSIQIDVNETLPNGQVNPNFLRPFVFGRGIGNYTDADSEAFRVTGSYEFDFAEKAPRLGFLGKHRLAALYSTRNQEQFRYVWEPKISQHEPAFASDYDLQGAVRRVAQIYYVGDRFTADQEFPTYTGFPQVGPQLGQPFELDYFDTAAGTWSSADPNDSIRPQTVTMDRLVHNPPTSASKSEVSGYGGSMQSFFWDGRLVTTIGWRKDEISSWTIEGPSPGENGLMSLDRSLPGWQFPAEPDTDPQSGATISKGLVFSPTRWMSLHYNESENFEVSAQKVDIFRRPIPSSGGDGKDYGFSVSLLKNKLNAKFNWFETAQVNADTGAFGFTSSWGVQGMERQLYGYLRRNDRLDEWVHPLGDKDTDGSGFDANYEKPSNVSDVNDFVSKGLEMEFTYNPTRNWRIAFNATKVETVQANSAAALLDYREMRLPYLQQFFDEQRNASQTWGEHYWNQIGKPLANAEAANGKTSTALSKWSANLVTNYSILEGGLRGLAFGGSVRWRQGAAIGYPDIETPEGVVRSDLDNPFYGPDSLNVGLHAAYQKRIFEGKVLWKVQLNIQNLIEEDDLIKNRVNPDGQVSSWRIGRDQVFQLTNTFKF